MPMALWIATRLVATALLKRAVKWTWKDLELECDSIFGVVSVLWTVATALLKRAVKWTCKDLELECDSIFRVVADAVTLSGSRRHCHDSDTKTARFFVLPALLSAVVLRVPPLSGERVRSAQ
ncbi:hypothetical protein ACP70R_037507 [Stipagrostis hirtigluma subsp. patula]